MATYLSFDTWLNLSRVQNHAKIEHSPMKGKFKFKCLIILGRNKTMSRATESTVKIIYSVWDTINE